MIYISPENDGPNIDCPRDITRTLSEGMSDMAITWDEPIPVDNDGVKSLESDYTSGMRFPIGTMPVTYTATDNLDNFSTCSFRVIIIGERVT